MRTIALALARLSHLGHGRRLPIAAWAAPSGPRAELQELHTVGQLAQLLLASPGGAAAAWHAAGLGRNYAMSGHLHLSGHRSRSLPPVLQRGRAGGRPMPMETEEERLQLDAEARAGMEEYMKLLEELAEQGNVRAQQTAWKWTIRKKVWNYLEDNDLADFPRPVHHRIPNFVQSAIAGQRIKELPEWTDVKTVKINPDTPQKAVRIAALEDEKNLLVPQPRLRTGLFSQLEPGSVNPQKYKFAATAGGMRQLAEPLTLMQTPKVDMIVVGSSAVNPINGARIGKGEGFAELEYGIMRELGMIDENTPIVTTIHDSQVISDDFPPKDKEMMVHDVPVDIIVTPTQIIRVDPKKRLPKPTGIYWNLVSKEKIAKIKVLRQLKDMLEKQRGVKIQLAEQEEALPPLAKRESKKR